MSSYIAYGNETVTLVPVEEQTVTGAQIQATPQVTKNNSVASQNISLELLSLVERLQQEVALLRGQFEELNHRVNKTDATQKDRYVDLDRRITQLKDSLNNLQKGQLVVANSAAASTVQVAAGNSDTATNSELTADPAVQQSQYKEAFNLIRSKKYAEAIQALTTFIDSYPQGTYTVNAHYWLGEVYLVQSEPELALKHFELVVSDYPQHRKAPDAMYKMARALMNLGEQAKGDAMLVRVIAEHPQSSAAQLARQFQ